MGININDSIKNILKTFTQKQVNEWSMMQKVDSVPVEEFISEFNDYSKEGLASLVVTQAMIQGKDVNALEKSETDTDKIELFYKLAKRRLLKEGYSEDMSDKVILEVIGTSSNVDNLLDKEMENLGKVDESVQ
jgi:uncharacterized protein (DUF2342 family)